MNQIHVPPIPEKSEQTTKTEDYFKVTTLKTIDTGLPAIDKQAVQVQHFLLLLMN